MKRLIIVLVAALTLGGCANIQNGFNEIKTAVHDTFTPDNFDSVTILMGTAESAGYSYKDLCERKIINKKCWIAIENLQPYENKAYLAYNALKKFVKSNPTADASTFIKEAKDAITSFRNLQKQNGMK